MNQPVEESRFILTVDGGGSKTQAELRDGTGRLLAHGAAGPCNLYQDPVAGLAAINAVWRQCCKAVNRHASIRMRVRAGRC